MTICGQYGKRHLIFHTVLVFTILAVIFTTALTAMGLSAPDREAYVRSPARFTRKGGGLGDGPRSRTGEDSRMDLTRSWYNQP